MAVCEETIALVDPTELFSVFVHGISASAPMDTHRHEEALAYG